MKMKSKILIAVLAVFFLAAGNAFAIPFDVTYTATAVTGGYQLYFSITDNMDYSTYQKGVVNFYINVSGTGSNPYGWSVTSLTRNFSGYGGTNTDYLIRFQDTITPYELNNDTATGETFSGFIVTTSSLPDVVRFVIQANGGTIPYDGGDNLNTGANYTKIVVAPVFEGVATDPPVTQVPEPATLLLLGIGLIGMAISRKKLSR